MCLGWWVFIGSILAAIIIALRIVQLEGRLDERAKAIETLRAENVTLRAALESRLQAQNYPHGFRIALPYLREWPD